MAESIYKEIEFKFKKRKFAEIQEKDYKKLLNTLYTDWFSYCYSDAGLPQDYIDLRRWVYDRVSKDMVYQRTGYLNDHFCIGTVFGMFRMFDSLTYNDKVFTYWVLDEEVRKKYGVV